MHLIHMIHFTVINRSSAMFYNQRTNKCTNHSLILGQQRSFFPLFPLNLVGTRKVPGKHLLHFGSKLVTQDNRIHLVIV